MCDFVPEARAAPLSMTPASSSEVNSAELLAGRGPRTGGGGRRGFSDDNNQIRDRRKTSSHGYIVLVLKDWNTAK